MTPSRKRTQPTSDGSSLAALFPSMAMARLVVVEYSAGAARQRARSGHPFLSRMLAEPKTWIYGGPESLGATEAA